MTNPPCDCPGFFYNVLIPCSGEILVGANFRIVDAKSDDEFFVGMLHAPHPCINLYVLFSYWKYSYEYTKFCTL